MNEDKMREALTRATPWLAEYLRHLRARNDPKALNLTNDLAEVRAALSSPHPEAREEAFLEALTPSAETKTAYIGEFDFDIPESDEDGEEVMRQVNIPWTTIKDIMAAIKARALSRLAAPAKIDPWYGLVSTYPNLAGDDPLRRAYEAGVHDAESRLAAPKPEGQALTFEQVGWLRMVLGRALYRVEHFPGQSNDEGIEADELAKAIILLGGEPSAHEPRPAEEPAPAPSEEN